MNRLQILWLLLLTGCVGVAGAQVLGEPLTARESTVEVAIEILESSRDHTIILCEFLRSQNRNADPATPWTLKECATVVFARSMRSLEDARTQRAREIVRDNAQKDRSNTLQLQYPDKPSQQQ